jgi:hypothetical protein
MFLPDLKSFFPEEYNFARSGTAILRAWRDARLQLGGNEDMRNHFDRSTSKPPWFSFVVSCREGGPADAKVDPTGDSPIARAVQTTGSCGLYGWRVSKAGDVNGDGYGDVLIAAREYREVSWSEGKLYVYFGSPAGPAIIADWEYACDEEMGMLGWSAAGGGDVNGDGYDDIIAGQISHQTGGINPGAALAFYGSSDGLGAIPDWFVPGPRNDTFFGCSTDILGGRERRRLRRCRGRGGHIFYRHRGRRGICLLRLAQRFAGQPRLAGFGVALRRALRRERRRGGRCERRRLQGFDRRRAAL